MKDVDRPAHVESFPEPTRSHRLCAKTQTERNVFFSQHVHRIARQQGWIRDIGDEPAKDMRAANAPGEGLLLTEEAFA
jgi:hypothetical protein